MIRGLALLVVSACLAAAEPDLRSLARELDVLIDADLAARHLVPNQPCDDAAFVRRTWIDLGGRIPLASDATAFLDDHRPDKRERLAVAVAATAAWEMAQFSWLADLLRVQSRLQDRLPGQGWIDWLKTAIHEGRGWDRMASEMTTATGHCFAADGGATGWALRDAGMPLDHAAIGAQTFLGTRIGCAQCHDHPFDTWTRLDFLRFAAASANAKADLKRKGVDPAVRRQLADAPPELRNAARNLSAILGARVEAASRSWLPVPADYQYQDAHAGDRIPARVLFAPSADLPADGDARRAMAAWMTSPDNRRFALAIGNRLWKRLFGLGLVEPVDDLRGDPDQPLPPLQAKLVQVVVACAFDLRRIELVLCGTRHWQRTTWTGELPAGGGVVPGRPAQRLGAQAWWDSLVALTINDPEARSGASAAPLVALRDRIEAGGADAVMATAERLAAMRTGKGAAVAAQDPELAAVVQTMRPRPAKELLRAAELPQPAPAGHPLRVLGQSDRELVDNGSNQPQTTQALLLMNGIIDSEVLARHSRLVRDLAAIDPLPARIEHLWLAVLSRRPSQAEADLASQTVRGNARTGMQDLAWALLNGSEFRMIP